MRNKKLPQRSGLIAVSNHMPSKTRVVYLHRDGTTTNELVQLMPATNELYGVRYTRGTPRRTHFLAVGDITDLSGDVVRIFSEVPVT